MPDNFYQKNSLGERGFPRDAIIKELRRANKLKCSFCQKIGANIGCAIEKCTKKFHYPCAVGTFSFNLDGHFSQAYVS